MVHFKLCGILIFFYNFSTEFFLEINFCLWLFYRERSREKPLGITLHEIPVPLPPGSVPSTGILWEVLWVEVPLWNLSWVINPVSTVLTWICRLEKIYSLIYVSFSTNVKYILLIDLEIV